MRVIFGDFSVTGNHRSAAAKLALLGATALLIALGGCGRKGPLDLPPTASNPPPPQASTTAQAPASPTANPLGLLDPNPPEQAPQAAPGRKKRIILDPILD
jgi:predicted small lipoprotein YifL